MSVILLDANVFSYVLRGHALGALYDQHLQGNQQTLCFAVVAELLQGAKRKAWGPKSIAKLEQAMKNLTILPYDVGVVRTWADLHDATNPDGSSRTFENNDRWIAACAIHHGITLVTHNRRHFEGIPGLKLISEAPPP